MKTCWTDGCRLTAQPMRNYCAGCLTVEYLAKKEREKAKTEKTVKEKRSRKNKPREEFDNADRDREIMDVIENEGLCYREAAERFSISKSAVSGVVDRDRKHKKCDAVT